jgi:hypothetical protein
MPRRRRRPGHLPAHALPVSVPGDVLVIHTDNAAVWVGAVRAYPNGFEFSLRAVRRQVADGSTPGVGMSVEPVLGGEPQGPPQGQVQQPGGEPQGSPQGQVQPQRPLFADPFRPVAPNSGMRPAMSYADGRNASVGEGVRPVLDQPEGEYGLWLLERSGGGNEWTWDAQFWVAPLPPDGPVTLAGAWLDLGVEAGADVRRAELDGTAIRAAGERAVQLWPEGEYVDDGPSHTMGTLVVEAGHGDGAATE